MRTTIDIDDHTIKMTAETREEEDLLWRIRDAGFATVYSPGPFTLIFPMIQSQGSLKTHEPS